MMKAKAKLFRNVLAVSLGAALAIQLVGCRSPFHENANHGWSLYDSSLLAHSLAGDGLSGGAMIRAPVDEGVQEMPSASGDRSIPGDGNGSTTKASTKSAARESPPATTTAAGGHVVYMSLEQAIEDALAHSLAIKVQAYNPAITQAQVVRAQAVFDPLFFGQSQFQKLNSPQPYPPTLGGPPSLIGVNNEALFNNELGVRKLLSTGGTVEFNGADNYQDIHSSTSLPPDINSAHTAIFGLKLSQPLLRGFGADVNRADIYIAQRNQSIALAQFRGKVIAHVAAVEQTYLQLVQAHSDVRIQRRLLTATRRTLRRLEERNKMDVNAVQIDQARVVIARAAYDLFTARQRQRDTSAALEAQLNDPAVSLRHAVRIIPTDHPSAVPIAFDLGHDISLALRQRAIIRKDRLEMEKAGIRLNVARNKLLPKLNLIASTDTTGLADNGSLPGAFNRSMSDPHFGYAAGLTLEVPIGNRLARARLRERELQRRQLLTQMLLDAQQVILQVETSLRDLQVAYQQIRMARRQRRAASGVRRGLRVEARAGQALTPTFLQLELDAQQNLAAARQTEVRTTIRYNREIVALERYKGTLLGFDHIAISPHAP